MTIVKRVIPAGNNNHQPFTLIVKYIHYTTKIKENKSDAMMHDMMIGWLIVYVFNVHPHESFLQNPIINHTVVATSPRISAELHIAQSQWQYQDGNCG